MLDADSFEVIQLVCHTVAITIDDQIIAFSGPQWFKRINFPHLRSHPDSFWVLRCQYFYNIRCWTRSTRDVESAASSIIPQCAQWNIDRFGPIHKQTDDLSIRLSTTSIMQRCPITSFHLKWRLASSMSTSKNRYSSKRGWAHGIGYVLTENVQGCCSISRFVPGRLFRVRPCSLDECVPLLCDGILIKNWYSLEIGHFY